MKTIGGTLPVHNCLSLDYCFMEALTSLLAFCDEVVVADAQSTDGTREVLQAWSKWDKRIKIIDWQWPTIPDGTFVAKWNNFAREHLSTDMQFYLQADEVVHEASISTLRSAAERGTSLVCRRLNFWLDTKHLVPENELCSGWVVRFGPQKLWMVEDAPMPLGDNRICLNAITSTVEIFHYGFIRYNAAFFAKQREFQPMFAGSYGKDLEKLEAEGKRCTDGYSFRCPEYSGTHPRAAQAWLMRHGY